MATYKVKAYGKEYTVEVVEQPSGARIIVEGYSFEVEQAAPGSVPGQSVARPAAARPTPPVAASVATAAPAKAKRSASRAAPAAPVAKPSSAGAGAVVAPIPGVVTKICVTEGEEVKAGQTVVKLEAMKMENDITALISGVVRQIAVDEGAEVSDGQLLVLVG